VNFSILTFFIFLLFSVSVYSQNAEADKSMIVANLFENFEYKKAEPRKLMALNQKSFISKINPVVYISAGLLFFYQRIISEQIQADCTYEISCSSYTKHAIERYGFKGFLIGIHQLNNCAPTVIDDYPKFKISEKNKINNSFEIE
jgi:uncharacterized protein